MARLLPIALALLAVVGLGLAAATVDSAVGGEADAGGGGDLITEGYGDGSNATPDVPLEIFAVLYLTGIAIGGYVIYRMYGVEFYLLLLVGFVFSLVVIAVLEPTPMGGIVPSTEPPGSPDPVDDGAEATDSVDSPLAVYLLVIGLAGLLWAGYVLVDRQRPKSADEDDTDVDRADEGEPLAAVGRSAGRAADRIGDQASADNAVFRAWREMTDLLDVDHRRATPQEFADAAVDAGMNPEDVATLTDTFEVVRYGGEPITDERAGAATRALRRIEEEYARDAGNPETTDARAVDDGGDPKRRRDGPDHSDSAGGCD